MCCLNKNITLWISQNTAIAAAQHCARLASFKNSTKAQLTVATEEIFFFLNSKLVPQVNHTNNISVYETESRSQKYREYHSSLTRPQWLLVWGWSEVFLVFWSVDVKLQLRVKSPWQWGTHSITQNAQPERHISELHDSALHNQSCSKYPNEYSNAGDLLYNSK